MAKVIVSSKRVKKHRTNRVSEGRQVKKKTGVYVIIRMTERD